MPNIQFLISDIRALWRSGLSARVPECQKLKNGTFCVCLRQRVGARKLATVHTGEPGESEETTRVLSETSRRHGFADEVVRHGHVEPVQLRQ